MTDIAPLLDTIRAFVTDHVRPLEPEFLSKGFGAVEQKLQAARAEGRRIGIWAPHLPREYGGLGLSLVDVARVSAVLGETPLGHYALHCQAPDVGNMELLLSHGSDDQKTAWLVPLTRGEMRSCFAMTEPEFAGSNPVRLATMAVRDGTDYVVTGHKWFTSGAEGSSFAIVMAVTDPGAKPHQRASMLIVPMNAPGVQRIRNIPVMGESGDGWASHAEMRFENVRVPAGNRIGGEGEGFALAQERLGPGRIHHCMRWIGICERSIELMARRALTRELAPGESLATKQVVRHAIADTRAETDAARALVLETAARIEQNGARASRMAISVIKYHVAGVLLRALDRAIQIFGAAGLTDETPLGWWYRHERGARIYDGADEVHKDVVAREVLKQFETRV